VFEWAFLKARVPSLVTQAQRDLAEAVLDTVCLHLDKSFGGNLTEAAKARDKLNQLLKLVVRASEVAEQVAEIPEEGRSPEAQKFVTLPAEASEQDTFVGLMASLAELQTSIALSDWYRGQSFRGIVSQKLRNELYDAIRKKKRELCDEK